MSAVLDRFRFMARSGPREKTTVRAEAPTVGNREPGVAVLRLYDPIDSWGEFWGVSAKEFAQVLDDLGEDVTTIRLHINSPGGEVWDGLAILNALRQHPARVQVVVDGIAASAASFIAMAGDEVLMAPNSELMIHDAWGLCMGNAADMQRTADYLAHESDNIAQAYAGRAGGTAAEWRELMREETWFTAEEAVTAGLADRVLDGTPEAATEAKARFDLSMYAHAGRSQAPAPTKTPASASAAVAPTRERSSAVDEEQLTTMRQQLGLQEDADGATILAALNEALDERAEPPAEPTPATTSTLPEGVVAVDVAVLADLRTKAEAGQRAATRQETEDREGLVRAAVADGRIPPARREHYLNLLTLDPEGTAKALAGLTPGLIPVTQETGHAGNPEASQQNLGWFGGTPQTRKKETR